MWDQYPTYLKDAVTKKVGGAILRDFNNDPNNYNTCCIRTCLALNYGGAPVSKACVII
jgi:hypothetical protein